MRSILTNSNELKKLIAEHPDYLICVLAGEEANGGDYSWMFCSKVKFEVGEFLDTETPYDREGVFTDRDDFYECLENECWGDLGMSDEEVERLVESEKAKYDPYWKPVIYIYATN